MSKMSYLCFNPETREIELEGTEEFIKVYRNLFRQTSAIGATIG